MIPLRAHLDLSTPDQPRMFDSEATISGDGTAIAIEARPDDANRNAAILEVTGTTAGSLSRNRWWYPSASARRHWQFRWRHTVAGTPTGQNRCFRALNAAGDEIFRVQRQSSTACSVTDFGANQTNWSTALLKDTDGLIEIEYLDNGNETADLILKLNGSAVVTKSGGTPMTVPVDGIVDSFQIQCEPTGNVLAAAGDKSCWFWDLSWAPLAAQLGVPNHTITVLECGSKSSPTTVDVVLQFIASMATTQIPGNCTDLAAQFKYRKTSIGGAYTNAGSPVSLTQLGSTNKWQCTKVVEGLDPNDQYDWLCSITGTGVSFDTETGTFRTPPATSGSNGSFSFCASGCNLQFNDSTVLYPKSAGDTILSLNPHQMIELGDHAYGPEEIVGGDEFITQFLGYHTNFILDPGKRLLRANVSHKHSRSDWDNGGDGFNGPANSATTEWAEAENVREFFYESALLNPIAGGKGSWLASRNMLQIDLDMSTNFDIGGASPDVMLGATQLAAVLALIDGCTQPWLCLISPNPAMAGFGLSATETASPTGWHKTAELKAEFLSLLTAAEANDNIRGVIIISSDAHVGVVGRDTLWPSKVKAEYCCGPYTRGRRNITAATFASAGGTDLEYIDDDVLFPAGDFISRFGYFSLASNLTLTARLYNGSTGDILHSATYSPNPAAGGSSSASHLPTRYLTMEDPLSLLTPP